jgi:flavodoxin I
VPSLHIIYASTSGHTEFVIDTLMAYLKAQKPALAVEKRRVELAMPEDLLKGDVVLLASGTWNTGGIEGQLNPHMHAFLKEKAAAADLKGKHVAVIGLGDARYRYTAKAADHLEEFVRTHGGELLCEGLRVVNEPYGQEKKVQEWGKKLLSKISTR